MKDVVLLVLDFDGVLTDNRVQVHQSGEESVWCHRGDGWGIARLKEAGIDVVVLSTEKNPVVTARCRKLRIDVIQGCDDKLTALQQLAAERQLTPPQIAYVGNDLNDLACMQWVGWAIAVADAIPEIRALARLVTDLPGGRGAVREVADRLLLAAHEQDPSLEAARAFIWRRTAINQTIAGSTELLTLLIRAARIMSEVLTSGRRVYLLSDVPSTAAAHYLAAMIARLAHDHGALAPTVLPADIMPSRCATSAPGDGPDLHLDPQARPGDMAVSITVRGDSPAIFSVMSTARHRGLHTLALTGADAGHLSAATDVCIRVPSSDTLAIPDAHVLVGRVLADRLALAFPPVVPMTSQGDPAASVE